MLDFRDDPYNWVRYTFPWGRKGTPVENHSGPKEWQKQELLRIGQFITENKQRMKEGKEPQIYQAAVASGRGIGKSALVSWLALWHMSTKFGAPSIVSANTMAQLSKYTFAEIGKWQTLALNNFWFERNETTIKPAPWFADILKKQMGIDTQYYYIDGKLWNPDDPHSFAGAHSEYGMQVIFDEASGIPQNIWDVCDFFFTDRCPYMFWHAFANPRVNTGAFYNCFHANKNLWYTRNIDSRDVEGINHTKHHETVAQHGEDSDKARIEVRGEFPKQGDQQFISRGVVERATARALENGDNQEPLILGVDPARYGDDDTVIRLRQGRDARSFPATVMSGADNMAVANKVAHMVELFNPDGICIDAGAGSGIIDRLREIGLVVAEVDFGSKSEDPQYADHRTEIWGKMKEWLPGAMLPAPPLDKKHPDYKLVDDMCGPLYEFTGREQKIKLEAKEKMKKRGLKSPDNADALAVTFHAKFVRKDFTTSRKHQARYPIKAKGRDYKIFG